MTSGEWCGGPNRYTVYFRAKFDRPFASFGTWRDGRVAEGSRESANSGYNVSNGAFLRWSTNGGDRTVKAKVALSYVSTDGAGRNLAAEARGFDFEATRAAARAAWERELDRIGARGGSQAERETLYTALYHALLHPSTGSDVDGRYRGFDGDVHVMEDGTYYQTFSLWDTFRPQNPLRPDGRRPFSHPCPRRVRREPLRAVRLGRRPPVAALVG